MGDREGRQLIVNAAQCTGCLTCSLICAFVHEGRFSLARARIRVSKDEASGTCVPTYCRHCEPAPCVTVCPTGALFHDESRRVDWDESLCIHCGQCVVACPFAAVEFEHDGRMLKCDLCHGREMPQCARFCTAGALLWIAPTQLTELQIRSLRERESKRVHNGGRRADSV